MGSDMNTVIKAVGEMNENFNIIIADTLKSKTVADAATGKAGKGFAVVASEVKQLATQSVLNANDETAPKSV